MEMYKKLMAYYDSHDLLKLQEDWNNLESHKYRKKVYIDDLIDSWDMCHDSFNLGGFDEPEKIFIQTIQAPISMELFCYQ